MWLEARGVLTGLETLMFNNRKPSQGENLQGKDFFYTSLDVSHAAPSLYIQEVSQGTHGLPLV